MELRSFNISLSELVIQDILAKFGGKLESDPFKASGEAPCITGIAMDVGHIYKGDMLFGGNIYLYMNNTQHGYVLYVQSDKVKKGELPLIDVASLEEPRVTVARAQ